jgi:predicted RNA-binding Zn-ribbon protein involved in translation (DUF1610 family)
MSEHKNRIFECPNCYFAIPEHAIQSSAYNHDCPGCGTETLNYFTPVEEEDAEDND